MKILQINNYGYVRGGSDRYYLDVGQMLERAGHEVVYFTSASGRNVTASAYAVKGFNIDAPSMLDIPAYIYSQRAQQALKKLIVQERPDVAHLHIYYGQLTSSILPVLKKHGVPVVQTLHEYKLLCPVASMVRAEEACELCASGSYWPAVKYRCNRGSLARSAVTAAEAYVSRKMGAQDNVDHFMAVSDFVRLKMIEHGMPANKISTIHNFVRNEMFADNPKEGSYFLYFGRLEKLKGVSTLIRAMANVPHAELVIAGEGGARAQFEELAANLGLKNVRFVGFKSGQELRDLIAGAIAIVAPSEWNETFGLVLIESFAQCKPVIASKMGGMPEVVSEGQDGILFEAGNVGQLVTALEWMTENRGRAVEMGLAGQNKVRVKFSPDAHYEKLMGVYQQFVRI